MNKNEKRRIKKIYRNVHNLDLVSNELESVKNSLGFLGNKNPKFACESAYRILEQIALVVDDTIDDLNKVIPIEDLEEAGVFNI